MKVALFWSGIGLLYLGVILGFFSSSTLGLGIVLLAVICFGMAAAMEDN